MFRTEEIKEHMEVVGSDGQHVGTVDYLEGSDSIKLTKSDAKDGKHHLIPADWVDRVDQKVYLKKSSQDAKAQMKAAA
jgi:hypothetical protein